MDGIEGAHGDAKRKVQMRYDALRFDSSQFLPEDQREQSGSVASWDPQQRPTSSRQSSFRPQTFPFLRPLLFRLWVIDEDE